jgi:hypothetical protein
MGDPTQYLSVGEFRGELEDLAVFESFRESEDDLLREIGDREEEVLGCLDSLYCAFDAPEKPRKKEDIPRYLHELATVVGKAEEKYWRPKYRKYVNAAALSAGGVQFAANVAGQAYKPLEFILDGIAASLAVLPWVVNRIYKSRFEKKNPEMTAALKMGMSKYCKEISRGFSELLGSRRGDVAYTGLVVKTATS